MICVVKNVTCWVPPQMGVRKMVLVNMKCDSQRSKLVDWS
jgi:hypothetical protein